MEEEVKHLAENNQILRDKFKLMQELTRKKEDDLSRQISELRADINLSKSSSVRVKEVPVSQP